VGALCSRKFEIACRRRAGKAKDADDQTLVDEIEIADRLTFQRQTVQVRNNTCQREVSNRSQTILLLVCAKRGGRWLIQAAQNTDIMSNAVESSSLGRHAERATADLDTSRRHAAWHARSADLKIQAMPRGDDPGDDQTAPSQSPGNFP
jgi:hypothetical protein